MTGPFCFCAIVIIRFLAKPVNDACFIDVQGSAVKFLAVECSHGGVRLGLVTHGDEGKSARLSSHAVHHKRDFADGAMLFEKILQIVLGSLKGEVSYV